VSESRFVQSAVQRNTMFRYRGLVDFRILTRVPGAELPVERHDRMRRCTLPGLDLQWSAGDVDVAGTDRVIVVATGQAPAAALAHRDAAGWLERYLRDGPHAADDVGGAFSVVVLDLAAHRAMLFVDRFAIETLCYRVGEATLGFADRACDVPNSSSQLDAQSIFDYLYFPLIPAPGTVYADVRRVEPAHRVIITASGEQASSYWRPAFVEDDRRDLAGRLARFRAIVKDSVAQEAGDDHTACFLSGGTDSSTVAGMLTQIRGVPAHAYSIGFHAEGYDEMAYARIAARHFGLVHKEYYVTPDDVADAVPKLAASFDQPFGNSSVLPAYYCARRAKEDGFTRLLAGDGGDELFAGNTRYALQQVFELYHRMPRGLRRGLLEPAAVNWKLFTRVPGFRQLGGYVRHSRHPMPERLETFQLLDQLGQEDMFEPEFRASIDPGQPLRQQRAHWQTNHAKSLVNRMLEYDWKYTLADNDLPKVRMATQFAGATVGFPLLSRDLTDFSLAIPPEWKLRRMKLRWFYKEALRGFLPLDILRKKKHGFGLPFGHWALARGPLRALVDDSLHGVARRGIVRPPFVERLLTVHLQEAPGYYGEMVWILTMLEQWLRAHESAHQDVIHSRVQPVT
jgi:asparagine synthase (glutamine-hydrolysing)